MGTRIFRVEYHCKADSGTWTENHISVVANDAVKAVEKVKSLLSEFGDAINLSIDLEAEAD